MAKTKTQPSQCMRYFAMVSAAVLALSAFLSWGSVSSASVPGLEGDGMITMILGIAALISLSRHKLPLCIPAILGLLALAVSGWDYLSLSKAMLELSGKVDAGLYITIVSSFFLTVGSLLARKGCKG